MSRVKSFFLKYRLPILSGILIGTSYIPFPPWASLFAFVPLWIFVARAESIKSAIFGGWITQIVLTLVGFNWIAFTAHEFGGLNWPLAILALFGFCMIANLDVPLAMGLGLWLRKKWNIPQPHFWILLALLTAVFESWVPTLFPWNYGYTFLWIRSPVAQLAEIIGFQGISSIVILGNLVSLQIWLHRKEKKGRVFIAYLVGGFLALNAAGLLLKTNLPNPDAEANVLVAQANIGNLERQYAERGYGFREHIVQRYLAVTESGFEKPHGRVDFIVWPETAFPYEIDLRRPLSAYVQSLLQKVASWDVPLITGGYGYGVSKTEPNKVSNSIFILQRNGTVAPNPYAKTTLLAFGEYIPGAEWFPQIKQWIPAGDFSRGSGPTSLLIDDITVGPQVCYEALFPDFSRKSAELGAQILINVTNDSWYGEWQEPFQHLFMTLARAVEFRRPMVRSSNTGISAVTLADGTILEQSPMNAEWVGIYKIPYLTHPEATLYQQYPWLMDALLIILLLALIGRYFIGRTAKP